MTANIYLSTALAQSAMYLPVIFAVKNRLLAGAMSAELYSASFARTYTTIGRVPRNQND